MDFKLYSHLERRLIEDIERLKAEIATHPRAILEASAKAFAECNKIYAEGGWSAYNPYQQKLDAMKETS